MNDGPPLDDDGLPVETPGRVDISLAVVVRDGRVLVARRAQGLHLAGYWEFPGGKVEAGETPIAAARRELREETALSAEHLEPLTIVVHDYAEAPLRFHVFLVRRTRGDLRMDGDREYAWKRVDELEALELPPANRQIVRALRWRLPR